jgi:hypothetical protein
MTGKTVINLAATGFFTAKEQSRNIPYAPDEITGDAVENNAGIRGLPLTLEILTGETLRYIPERPFL